jgi:hypothetical protein
MVALYWVANAPILENYSPAHFSPLNHHAIGNERAAKAKIALPWTHTIGEICCNRLAHNKLKLQSFVNHIISILPSVHPLILVLLSALI